MLSITEGFFGGGNSNGGNNRMAAVSNTVQNLKDQGSAIGSAFKTVLPIGLMTIGGLAGMAGMGLGAMGHVDDTGASAFTQQTSDLANNLRTYGPMLSMAGMGLMMPQRLKMTAKVAQQGYAKARQEQMNQRNMAQQQQYYPGRMPPGPQQPMIQQPQQSYYPGRIPQAPQQSVYQQQPQPQYGGISPQQQVYQQRYRMSPQQLPPNQIPQQNFRPGT